MQKMSTSNQDPGIVSLIPPAFTVRTDESGTSVVVPKRNIFDKRRRRNLCTCRAICFLLLLAYSLSYMSLSSNPRDYTPRVQTQSWTDGSNSEQWNKNTNAAPSSSSSVYETNLPIIQEVAGTIARPYHPVPPNMWCVDQRLSLDQLKRRPMGLCYIKMPRAASDTLRSINMRIAEQFGQRQGLEGCIRHDAHQLGMYYEMRDKMSYLWTFVRDPTQRAMSAVGAKLSQQLLGNRSREEFWQSLPRSSSKNSTTSVSFAASPILNLTHKVMNLLQHATRIHDGIVSEGRGGFQLQFGMQSYIEAYSVVDPLNPSEVDLYHLALSVQKTFRKYNFIGVVERFDESLVALQLLMSLEPTDILYFATNTRHQWQRAKVPSNQYVCRKPLDWEEDFLNIPDIQNYLLYDREWFAQNYGDYVLYHVANMALDQTILKIGIEVFSRELKHFRTLLAEVHEVCFPKFPCSENGTDQMLASQLDCVEGKVGCGFQCLNAFSRNKTNNDLGIASD